MSEQLHPDEKASDVYIQPGQAGHNAKEVVWERWQKKRTFVRALEGTYGEVYKGLYQQPRVINSHDFKWKGGPQLYDKSVINPASASTPSRSSATSTPSRPTAPASSTAT